MGGSPAGSRLGSMPQSSAREMPPHRTPANDDAFAAQLSQHIAAVLRVAAALVGVADAEDAAQEAILRGWQAWPTLRDPMSVRPWLLRITVNVCRDWQRGRFGTHRRRTEPLADDPSIEQLALLGDDPGASDHAAALDLRRAINALDEDLRLVLALRYYAGMDATAAGAALGIPSGTVRTRLRRALRLLREQLGGAQSQRPDSSDPQEGGAHVE
jgi:RNA polymerase sigma factor (sigma-70 family)